MDTTNSINVADLNEGEKLTDKNYDIWHRKIQFLLDEQDMLDTITQSMVESEYGNTMQHRHDMELYQSFKCKDHVARILMLGSMQNDFIFRFEKHKTAKALWDAVKLQLGGTSTTPLRHLTLNFERFVKKPRTTMRQHLSMMANMISELREFGHVLSDEQQVQAVIRSLPPSWEQVRVNLTHDENIKTFDDDDVSKYVELEKERLLAYKYNSKVKVLESFKRKALSFSGSQARPLRS